MSPGPSAAAPRVGSPICTPGEFQRRLPAVTVAAVFASGILVDRFCSLSAAHWIGLGGAVWALWLALWLRRRAGPVRARWAVAVDWVHLATLLLALLACGGAWHHLTWSSTGPDEIARYAEDNPVPVRLRGRIADRPVRLPRRDSTFSSNRPRRDRWVCLVECLSLESLTASTPVTGRCRLEVDGELTHVGPGDLVDVVGNFSRPRGPANPGGFDFRSFLRAAGIHCTVRCGEPDDVRLVTRGSAWWRRGQGALRVSAESLLTRNLSPGTAPVGTALLLGTRTTIPEDLRTAFAESGTMHILAISGANVAILAGLLWGIARLLFLGRGWSTVLIVAGVSGYAFLADSQPPVLRAVLMVIAVASGQAWHRRGAMAHGLALAVLGVLVWNPTHLFDTGAQLSFLAVSALIWAPSLARELPSLRSQPDPLDRLERQFSRWRRSVGWLYDQTRVAAVALAAIWLFTLPLTTARFHLVSPVGFAANLLLAPISVVVLWAGY
ncbi:MAG: ComEC family competence protein, partial [Planctomycetaceae bacterium]